MAQLNKVNPGDPITAANWNALVAAVQALSGTVSTGGVTVPSLFGLTLSNAVAILNLPSTQLTTGSILDTLGNTVNPAQADSKTLLVLYQMPMPDSTVFAGSSVNLVVAPKPGATTPVPQVPAVSDFKPKPSVPIGSEIELDGQNFGTIPASNQVTFAGVTANPPSAKSNVAALFVVVPTGIPGAPTTAGQTLDVDVIVKAPLGNTAPFKVKIAPPLANPLPTITLITPLPPAQGGPGGLVGNDITITGTGFDSTPANDSVIFDNVTVTAKTATTTQLTVTIPSGINGMTTAGDSRSIAITVKVAGQVSPAASYFIKRLV